MKSMRSEKKMVPIADLKFDLFVRVALNQDHVLGFAELIEAGVALKPILINQQGVVIDGRHRIEAHALNHRTEIEAEVVDVTDEAEMIVMAYIANKGGSLPPSTADTEHTVMMLLDRSVSQKSIGEYLQLPPSLARKYISNLKSKAARAKLMRAAAAVTDGGFTVAKAAEVHGVELDKLKETLSGHRKKHKKGVFDLQRGLTSQYRSAGQKHAAMMKGLLEKYEDCEVTAMQVREIIAHVEALQKKAARSIADWKRRFEALVPGSKSTVKAKAAETAA